MMKLLEKDLVMLTSYRGLRLGGILQILNVLRKGLKYEKGLNIDDKKLVDAFRDIEVLNKYIYMSDVDFAKQMLSIIGLTGKEIEKAVEECIANWSGDFDTEDDEFIVPAYVFTAAEAEDVSEMCIVDPSKQRIDYTKKCISYDFLVKMQSKLWNGILDSFLKVDDVYEDDYVFYRFDSVQKYDVDVIASISGWFEEDIRNWAMAHDITGGCSTDIQIIHLEEEEQYIISIDIAMDY